MTKTSFIVTTYNDGQGTEYRAIRLTWSQVREILGHDHTGSAEDDARLVEHLRSIGAPEWIEDAEGWTDEEGWGLIGPQVTYYVALTPHSYHYCEYDDHDSQGSSGYTYVRKPNPTERMRYADRPVTHIEVRPDVRIIVNDEKGAQVIWGLDMPCPFVRLEN